MQSMAECAMASFEQGPACVKEAVKEHAILNNIPRIGVKENYAFPTFQLNLAPAEKLGRGMLLMSHSKQRANLITGLGKAMGWYGGAHIDRGDDPGSYSYMGVNSDLPANYYKGRFHILGLGLYVRLDDHIGICFSGLEYHGGSPPTRPMEEKAKKWPYRNVTIGYPPRRMTDGIHGRPVIAALPKNKSLVLGPEITNAL